MTGLTLTRIASAGGPTDLVIAQSPADGLWIPEDGMGRPQFTFRKTHAPESNIIPGRSLLSAVQDQSGIPCTIYAGGATTEELDENIAILEAALGQFIYTVTQTIDGVDRDYEAECTTAAWGVVDSGEVRAHLCAASVVIPVNPPGA